MRPPPTGCRAARMNSAAGTGGPHELRSRHRGHVETFPIGMRYAYPAQLDLMAKLTGMRLTAR